MVSEENVNPGHDPQQNDLGAGIGANKGMRAVTRYWLLGLAAVLGTMAAFGLWRLHTEHPAHWARISPRIGATESPQISLQKALDEIADDQGPKKFGAQLPLAEFIQANGHRIEIILIEGQLFDKSIEPKEVWRKLGDNVLLVSSVDERRSKTGNLSSAISAGCLIPQDSGIIQELGSTSIDKCNGTYWDSFHIRWLARLSAIAESSSDAGHAPCWTRYGIAASEGDYQTCVSNAVSDGLKALFSEMHRRHPIDAIVIPAVGTGAGKLSKAGFYNKLLSDVLVKELSKPYDLPTPIYLLVQRNEAGNRWHETRIAMAGAVAAAVATWDFDTDHRSPDSEWVSLTGVAMGSCIILVALTFGARIGIAADLVPLTGDPKPLIFVAWISAAVGLVSMFKALLAFFPAHLSPYLHLIAGVLTAFICGPLIRANSAFDETVKFRKAASKSVATQPVDSNPNE